MNLELRKTDMADERLITRSLPFKASEIDALRKALGARQSLHFTPSRELERFEVSLPQDLGKIQAQLEKQYLVLWYRSVTAPIRDQERLAWINTPVDMFVSPRFGRNGELAKAVRGLLEQPLWHFLADQGRRVCCVFCGKKLDIPSSRMLGYGPVCARSLGLHWFNA